MSPTCWVCDSTTIHYRDILDMYWCEPCWNQADTEAAQAAQKAWHE